MSFTIITGFRRAEDEKAAGILRLPDVCFSPDIGRNDWYHGIGAEKEPDVKGPGL